MLKSKLVQLNPYSIVNQNGNFALDKNTHKKVYRVYDKATKAMSEVIYYRLSKLLGLPCAEAQYAYLNDKDHPVAATRIAEDWILWADWYYNQSSMPELKNEQELQSHLIINFITKRQIMDNDEYGYVTTDGYFVKACNDSAFMKSVLDIKLSGKGNAVASWVFDKVDADLVRNNFKNIDKSRDTLNLLSRITKNEIDELIEMPNWSGKETSQEFYQIMISNAKHTAWDLLN